MPEDLPQREARGDLRRWTDPVKKAYARFLKIRGNPKEIALGFALGILVGMTPFMGLHMAIAVPLAALLKWNKFSAALAVWISNPLSAPVVYGIAYYVGTKVLFIENGYQLPTQFNLDALLYTLRSAPEIIGILLVGGLVVGFPLAVAGYFFTLKAIVEYRASIKHKLEEKKATLARKLKRAKPRTQKKKRKKRR